MHPRNIFKNNKPDFSLLAQEFQDLLPYVKTGNSGKPYINFKDPSALRCLSIVLLKKHFDINLEIPLDRLIPTIPLRLNYIHWVEDLLTEDDYHNKNDVITGVDVGCGASCVYALLGNRINHWKFYVTEVDHASCQYAQKNVELNCMQNDVKVVKTIITDPFFKRISKEEESFLDFTMCNPPFFAETEEEKSNDRTKHRPLPNSISTATESEKVTEGGEVAFVRRMIAESLESKRVVRWFTTMLGKKSSLKPLLKMLRESQVPTITTTVFSQGRTSRWGLAWSFITQQQQQVTNSKKNKALKTFFLSLTDEFFEKTSIPTVTEEPKTGVISWEVAKIVEKEFIALKLKVNPPEHVRIMNGDAYEITGQAFHNTWAHQRRKRRKEKFGGSKEKILSSSNSICDGNTHQDGVLETDDINNINYGFPSKLSDEQTQSNVKHTSTSFSPDTAQCKRIKLDLTSDLMSLQNNLQNCADNEEVEKKPDTMKRDEVELDSTEENKDPLFVFSCTVGAANQFHATGGRTPTLSLVCLEGDKNQFHQLFLCLKNKLCGAVQVGSLCSKKN